MAACVALAIRVLDFEPVRGLRMQFHYVGDGWTLGERRSLVRGDFAHDVVVAPTDSLIRVGDVLVIAVHVASKESFKMGKERRKRAQTGNDWYQFVVMAVYGDIAAKVIEYTRQCHNGQNEEDWEASGRQQEPWRSLKAQR